MKGAVWLSELFGRLMFGAAVEDTAGLGDSSGGSRSRSRGYCVSGVHRGQVLHCRVPTLRDDDGAAGVESAFSDRHSPRNQVLLLLFRAFPESAGPASRTSQRRPWNQTPPSGDPPPVPDRGPRLLREHGAPLRRSLPQQEGDLV